MAARRDQLHHVTVCVLAWICTQYSVSALGGNKTPDGVCYLETNNTFTCNPELQVTSSLVSYVQENAVCGSKDTDLCYTCRQHSMVETKCHGTLLQREKRGFFKKLFRKGGNPFRKISGKINPLRKFGFGGLTRPNRKLSGLLRWGPFKFLKRNIFRCPSPKSPLHGSVHCPEGTALFKKCTYSCHSGYQLSGPATVTCNLKRVFPKPPTCQIIQCGKLTAPTNAKSASCTNGNRHKSVCSPVCNHGYAPARGARAVCNANKKWAKVSWTCDDVVKPVFTSCPTKKINTIDKKFKWKVTATDNTGKVTLKQVQGHPPGSLMTYGVHIIKYVATDAAGNSESCVFSVELKKSDCPRPTSDDKDMKFTCNGLTAQSVCHLSCRSGSFVQGSKYIACVQDTSENNTSYWQPIDGEKAACYKKTCPALSPPKNGALACDKQLGGTVCQIQCDDRFDVAPGEGTQATYICGTNMDVWKPSNVVPDCLELAYPDEYFLPTEFFYFMGDCSDPEALNDIKQQFIDNLNSIGLSPCMSDECSVDDINVECGDMKDPHEFDFRRKRSANLAKRVLHVRVTFHLKNSNRTLSPKAAAVLLNSLVDKSKNMMSANTMMRKMLLKTPRLPKPTMFKTHLKSFSFSKGFAARAKSKLSVASFDRPSTLPPKIKAKSVKGSMSMECPPGSVPLKTTSGICVPCSVGTYHDTRSHTCKPCPLNTYQNKPASTSCQRCPVHHTTSSKGAATSDACQELCGKDLFSPSGLVPCFPCPDGKHQPEYGAKTCVPCTVSTVRGQGSSKCSKKTKTSSNVTAIPSEFRISSFLLTCDSEICLSF